MRTAEALLPTRECLRRDFGWAAVAPSKMLGSRITQWSRSAGRRDRGAWIEPKPRELTPANKLLEAIEKSKAILDLPDDWDDAGSPPFKLETWERMRQTLVIHAALVWQRTGLVIPVPRILPGPDGSIDLHWKTPRRELLFNIPEDGRESATYYGDDFGEDRKKGCLDPGVLNPGLFTWLTETD